MSRMLSKMNLISVVQQLSKEDIETIQGYVEMIEQENDVQKAMIENFVKENQKLKEQLQQRDEVINKAKEYISKHTQHDENGYVVECLYVEKAKELLDIITCKIYNSLLKRR